MTPTAPRRPFGMGQPWTRWLVALAGVATLIGLVAAPRPAWAGVLIGFQFVLGMALAGVFFVAVIRLTQARWAEPLLPLCRGLGRTLPVAAGMALFLFLGVHSLYEWSHAAAATDALLQRKAAWLNVPFFWLRTVLYFGVWFLLARRLLGTREQPDRAPLDDPRQLRASALFLAAFGVTFSLASVDWVQSLQPHWFSTIFALRTSSGLVLAGLAVLTLVAVRRWPAAQEDMLADLGKLILAMSTVWVYLWYCQYMLIWYTNIPEETGYFLARQGPGWSTLQVSSLALNWAVPFLVLLLRRARRSRLVLTRVAWVLIMGRVIDLYLEVAPPVSGGGPRIDVWQVCAVFVCVAGFFLVLRRVLPAARLPVDARAAGSP